MFVCAGIRVVPGTPGPVANVEEAELFAKDHGLPIIFKAAFGGGGRGMRKVNKMEVCHSDHQVVVGPEGKYPKLKTPLKFRTF